MKKEVKKLKNNQANSERESDGQKSLQLDAKMDQYSKMIPNASSITIFFDSALKIE